MRQGRLTAGLCGALLLAGCGGSAEPTPQSHTGAATAVESRSATVTQTPEAMPTPALVATPAPTEEPAVGTPVPVEPPVVQVQSSPIPLPPPPAPRASQPIPTPTSAQPASVVGVQIDGFAFGPALTIATGTIVTWTNREAALHTVTASDGSFESPILGVGESYSRRFDLQGTYVYFCAVHPFMTSSVTAR
jgi:plastocyanin